VLYNAYSANSEATIFNGAEPITVDEGRTYIFSLYEATEQGLSDDYSYVAVETDFATVASDINGIKNSIDSNDAIVGITSIPQYE
jgi:hypothetical protein